MLNKKTIKNEIKPKQNFLVSYLKFEKIQNSNCSDLYETGDKFVF